ncbi:urease accessory protein UreF [Planotetraspora mira]|uniref:Urease accessory protein UreF n=2 Tax=Planotetraspora mira TaxID=58121 RepID=A0A8J3TK32_9ACTN|nr:urease accessory protein UreF [Planotetraspora mira]
MRQDIGEGRGAGMRDRPSGDAALLLLADSRLPAGGHAHSGGAEEAVRLGTITGPEDLARFLRGRLATAGLVTAALAAAACELAAATADHPAEPYGQADGDGNTPDAGTDADPARPWRRLDAEADARTASPAQREASRVQGRLLIRTARRIWPSAVLDTLAKAVPEGAHHPIALGAAAASAGCDPYQAAMAAAYNSVTGPATAAVRLLGLDPVTVHRLLADLAPALNDAAHAACASLIDDVVPDGAPQNGPAHNAATQNGAAAKTRGSGWPALPGHTAPALDLLAEGHLNNPMKLFVS